MKNVFIMMMIAFFMVMPNRNLSAEIADLYYMKIADRFLVFLNSEKTIEDSIPLKNNENIVGYTVRLKDGGYILIAADQSLPPVKAYSLTSNFDKLPSVYMDFLIKELSLPFTMSRRSIPIRDTHPGWDFLSTLDSSPHLRNDVPDTFLLKTEWNQDYPYNKKLPKIGDQYVLAGCAQVAESQIMKYYRFPQQGRGVLTHVWNDQRLVANLYRNFHWDNMPDVINSSTPEYMQDEIALLMRDLVVANKTECDVTGSGALINPDALFENFGYSTKIKEATNQQDDFFDILKSEIDQKRPVILGFVEHYTVADGYQSNSLGQMIHINMGWGGNDNDFYNLNETVYAGDYVFEPILDMIYNIMPCSEKENDCYVNLEPGDAINESLITGTFDYLNDTDSYDVILKGNTTLDGDRENISNQAFYIMVYDRLGELIKSSNDTIVADFPADQYRVKISLKNDSGGYYEYDENKKYTVTIATKKPTASEILVIQKDRPPAIQNEFDTMPIPELYKIRIDAGDVDGEAVFLAAESSNPLISAVIQNDILTLSTKSRNKCSEITVIALSGENEIRESFHVIVSDIAFGSEFSITGDFDGQDDVDTYEIVLDGSCTIRGSRSGLINQGFFVSIQSADGTSIIDPSHETIAHTFPQGRFVLSASLMQNPTGGGAYFLYKPETSAYTVSIECPEASTEIDSIRSVLGIESCTGYEPGDLNHSGEIDLEDVITALKIVSGVNASVYVDADVNGNDRIGIEEVVYIIQYVSGVR